MTSAAVPNIRGTAVPLAKPHSRDMLPAIVVESEAEGRGRLKRRRPSSGSPKRATSPPGDHDRNSGSRYGEHDGKHPRPSSPSSSVSPPTVVQKMTRRRSDAEPDHTLRGRARKRSGSRERTTSPLLGGEDSAEDRRRTPRKRSQPPSRPRVEPQDESAELRRQRSHVDFKQSRRDSKGEGGDGVAVDDGGVQHGGDALAV